jgi:hypothetical protein
MRAILTDWMALVRASELAVCCVRQVLAAAAPGKALVSPPGTLLVLHLQLTFPLMLLLRLLPPLRLLFQRGLSMVGAALRALIADCTVSVLARELAVCCVK